MDATFEEPEVDFGSDMDPRPWLRCMVLEY